MSDEAMEVIWHTKGRKAQCPPNPAYPDGVTVVLADDPAKPACKVNLPYPAPECGAWGIRCQVCGFSALITAAGRPDDPHGAILPCKIQGRA